MGSDKFGVSVSANLSEDNGATIYLFNQSGEQILFYDEGDGENSLPAFMNGSLAGIDNPRITDYIL